MITRTLLFELLLLFPLLFLCVCVCVCLCVCFPALSLVLLLSTHTHTQYTNKHNPPLHLLSHTIHESNSGNNSQSETEEFPFCPCYRVTLLGLARFLSLSTLLAA